MITEAEVREISGLLKNRDELRDCYNNIAQDRNQYGAGFSIKVVVESNVRGLEGTNRLTLPLSVDTVLEIYKRNIDEIDNRLKILGVERYAR